MNGISVLRSKIGLYFQKRSQNAGKQLIKSTKEFHKNSLASYKPLTHINLVFGALCLKS
jgi:hypothetical protein